MNVTCGRCGTDFDADRETRGDPERCPRCGTRADIDAGDAGSDRFNDGISCGLCGEPLPNMDHATDHLEDEHSVVELAILRNLNGIGGEPA